MELKVGMKAYDTDYTYEITEDLGSKMMLKVTRYTGFTLSNPTSRTTIEALFTKLDSKRASS